MIVQTCRPRNLRPGTGPGWRRTLALAIVILAWWASCGLATTGSAALLEDLRYRVDIMMFKDAARARLTLKSLGPGRYQAEISGESKGMLRLLGGERQESYRTEMVCRQGRLVPVVYQEESRRKGKRHLNEYRFDYAQGRVELWQLKEGKGLVQKWHTALKEEMYDPISAFYNCRLGALGQAKAGENIKVPGIPYPHPEDIEVRVGPETAEGRKTMISFINKAYDNSRGVVFAYVDGQGVPQQAWTSILKIGKVTGELLPESKALKEDLPELKSGKEAGKR